MGWIILIAIIWLIVGDHNGKKTNSRQNPQAPGSTYARQQAARRAQAARNRAAQEQAQQAEIRRQSELEQQRQRNYWANYNQQIAQHNAQVPNNRMTPGTSDASRTYWHP